MPHPHDGRGWVGILGCWHRLTQFGFLCGNVQVPEGYERRFTQAEQTFLYQLVWDVAAEKVVPLTPYPDYIDPSRLDFAGPVVDPAIAAAIVRGDVDPITGEALAVSSAKSVAAATRQPSAVAAKPRAVSEPTPQTNKMDR